MNILNMDEYIKTLQDPSKQHLKVKTYRNVLQSSESNCIPEEKVKILLDLFKNDVLVDIQCSSSLLGTIKNIVNKVKDGTYPEFSKLTSTANTIFDLLIMTAPLHQMQSVQKSSLDVLISYPDSCLLRVVTSYPQNICTLMIQYLSMPTIDLLTKKMILELLLNWLRVIPQNKRSEFVADGLNTWFSHLIPMLYIPGNAHRKVALEALENILPELNQIDYENNSKWLIIRNNIKDKEIYAAFIQRLFQSSDELWSRQFCCMIRLIGKDLKKNGSLLNGLLPVLEHTFKIEKSRKESFVCWKLIVDMFIANNNVNYKAIKLLTAPFIVNNAKSEEIAIVKFDLWWNFIIVIKDLINIRKESNLYPFLNFCTGCDRKIEKREGKKEEIIPGLVFKKLQDFTLKAVVELFGHEAQCLGCIGDSFPRITESVLNVTTFKESPERWIIVAEKITILISEHLSEANESQRKDFNQLTRCIWTSLINVSSKVEELSKTFDDILKSLQELTKESSDNAELAELIVRQILPIVANTKEGYTSSFLNEVNVNDESKHTPIQSLILLLLSPSLYKRDSMDLKLFSFSNLTTAGLDACVIAFCGWILPKLSNIGHCPALWCNLAEDMCCDNYIFNKDICNAVLVWLLNQDISNPKIVHVASSWKKLFTFMGLKVSTLKRNLNDLFDENIVSTILNSSKDLDHPSRCLVSMCILPSIIKRRLEDHPAGYVTYITPALEGIQNLLSHVEKMEVTDVSVISICEVTDAVGAILSAYNSRRATPPYVQLLFKVSEKMLGSILFMINQKWDACQMDLYVQSLLDTLPYFTIPVFKTKFNKSILDIISQLLKRNNTPSIKSKCYSILDQLLKKYETSTKNSTIDECTASKIQKILGTSTIDDKSFKFPDRAVKNTPIKEKEVINKDKDTPKGSKNGKLKKTKSDDEFVLIKPSWKFDPKKLTEHQKEVLTRRRENIPALYEDLSQSQDDYSMKPWKPVGYTSEGVSDSSRSRDREENLKDTKSVPEKQIHKLATNNNVEDTSAKKVLRNIPNPISIGSAKDLNTCQVTEILKEKPTLQKNISPEINDANIENIDLKLAKSDSPKLIDRLNKKNSIQSRLEMNMKKLREVSTNRLSSPPCNPLSPTLPESERPLRMKRKPNKFDPDDSRFMGKRRASTSVIEDRPITIASIIPISNKSNPIQDNLLPNTKESQPDDKNSEITPTKIKKKKSRLMKELEIDTVEGHPAKDIFSDTLKKSKRRSIGGQDTACQKNDENVKKRKRMSSVKKSAETCSTDIVEEVTDGSTTPKASSEHVGPASVLNNVDEPVEIISPNDSIINNSKNTSTDNQSLIVISDCENGPTLPESEDVIESSQDSSSSSIKVPRRISVARLKISIKNVISPATVVNSQPIHVINSEEIILSGEEIVVNDVLAPFVETPKRKSKEIKSPSSEITQKETNHLEETTKSGIRLEKNEIPVSDDYDSFSETATSQNVSVTLQVQVNKSPPNVTKNISSAVTIVEYEENATLSSEQLAEMDTLPILNSNCDNLSEKNESSAGLSTQEIAEADTEPMDREESLGNQAPIEMHGADSKEALAENDLKTNDNIVKDNSDIIELSDDEEFSSRLTATILSSPHKEDVEDRNTELLNSTIDISPIKSVTLSEDTTCMEDEACIDIPGTSSPERVEQEITVEDQVSSIDKECISPAKVIDVRVTSPVKPLQKVSSPDLFISEKVSPEKPSISDSNFSPPRPASAVSSPSSMLDQKKNRPMMSRINGRAAQMLGLCKIDLDNKECSDKNNMSPKGTIARKNLHNTYGNSLDTRIKKREDSELLEFSKVLPSPYASPAGPILKKILDDQTLSPSSKKKRVSFHDPPVSTSIKVQKYIENVSGVRSPQAKTRNHKDEFSFMKSPKVVKCLVKKMETDGSIAALILDTVLTKTSLLSDVCSLDTDTQQDMDITDFCLLDDTLPVYPSLCECTLSISEVASELSSTMWKDSFLDDIKDEISTIGDLAKLTELKVNRLPIKFPKVKTVKKALASLENKLLKKKSSEQSEATDIVKDKEIIENTVNPLQEFEKDDSPEKDVVTEENLANDSSTVRLMIEESFDSTADNEDVESQADAGVVEFPPSPECVVLEEPECGDEEVPLRGTKRKMASPNVPHKKSKNNVPEDEDIIKEDSVIKTDIIEDHVERVPCEDPGQMSEDNAVEIQKRLLQHPAALTFLSDNLVDHVTDEDAIRIQNQLMEKPSVKQYISDNIHKFLNHNLFDNPAIAQYVEDNLHKFFNVKIERRTKSLDQ